MLVLPNVIMKLSNMKKKNISLTECDKSKVRDIVLVLPNMTKCEKKHKVLPNVIKIQ